jgi:hypothetical protein
VISTDKQIKATTGCCGNNVLLCYPLYRTKQQSVRHARDTLCPLSNHETAQNVNNYFKCTVIKYAYLPQTQCSIKKLLTAPHRLDVHSSPPLFGSLLMYLSRLALKRTQWPLGRKMYKIEKIKRVIVSRQSQSSTSNTLEGEGVRREIISAPEGNL